MPATPSDEQQKKGPLGLELGFDLDVSKLPTKNFLIVSLLFFVGLAAFVMMVIVPTIRGIFTNIDAIAATNQELATFKEKLANLQSVLTNSDYTESSKLNQILFEDNPYVQAHYNIVDLLDRYNLKRTRFEYSPGLIATPSADFVTLTSESAIARYQAAEDSESYTIYMVVNGTFKDVIAFVTDIERYAPYNAVTYVEISNTLLGEVTAQLEISVFYHQTDVNATIETDLPEINSGAQETLAKLDDFVIPDFSNLYNSDFTGRDDIFSSITPQEGLTPDDQATADETQEVISDELLLELYNGTLW